MLHMKLEVSFVPKAGIVKGLVTHTFKPLQKKVDSLFLDGPGIKIIQAKLNEETIKIKTNSTGTTFYFNQSLDWNTTYNLTIKYEANPKKGIYFIGWNDKKNLSQKQIWTQGQGIDNRHWIPMYDELNDKLTTEIIVTFDKDYKVLSNGAKLKEKDNKDGTKTWHYKMSKPHASYLVMLGIGKYDIKETKSKSGVPMQFWYYPQYKDRVEFTYKYSEDMMDYFEEMIGVKYPWESYAQIPVQDFMYGAMENTTATVFGDFYLIDERAYLDRNYVGTNAHELAHQWFGDLITARSSAHHWLQESFATYYNMLYEKRAFGQDYYDWKRREATNSALKASLDNYKPIAHSNAGTTRHYPKGAHVLHMLKYVVGEEEYNKSIKYYLEKHAYKNVDSKDLLVAFHETLGVSLDWFWEQWVYRGGEPHYNVSFSDVIETNVRKTKIEISQIHHINDVVGYFKMPIILDVVYTDGTKDTKKAWVDGPNTSVIIPNKNNKEIAFILFDPNSEIMKKVDFDKPFQMLVNQAKKAENMLDRYDAVVALTNYPTAQKRDALLEVYKNEKFHLIKNEIIDQLKDESHPASISLIQDATEDKDVKVRLKVIEAIPYAPAPLNESFEALLKDSSYKVIEKTLEFLSLKNPDKTAKYLELTKDEVGAIGKNVRIKWLEIAYHLNHNENHLRELVDYTSNSYEFLTRVNAVNALISLNYLDENLLSNLIDAAGNANRRLAAPCIKAIEHFSNQIAYQNFMQDLLNKGKLDPEQRKILEKYLN
jgi:aminopeptidase N